MFFTVQKNDKSNENQKYEEKGENVNQKVGISEQKNIEKDND